MVAVSMDDVATMKKFKESLGAEYPMISDQQGKVVGLYDVKTAVLPFAQRYTFVIGQDRKVLSVQSGGDAIDPAGSIKACPLHQHAEAPAAAATGAKPEGQPAQPPAKDKKDGGK
jgi:thioredoxin-dependent peroxiredoxin